MKPSSKIFIVLSGLLLIALGIMCMCSPLETVNSLLWLLGLFLVAAGISSFVIWIDAHRFMPSSGSLLLYSILEVLLGVFCFTNTKSGSNFLPYIFAIFALAEGISLAIHSFDFRKVHFKGWWAMLIFGLAAAVLGVFCFINPLVGSHAISILLGISLILNGLVYVVAVFGVNKLERNVKKTIQNVKETIEEATAQSAKIGD